MNIKPSSGQAARLIFGLLVSSVTTVHAQLAPFALAVSETVSYQNNLFREIAPKALTDWLTSTGLRGEFDGFMGRQHLKAAAAVDFDRYRKNSYLDYNSPKLNVELDWSTAGLLAGELGAGWESSLYMYGLTGGLPYDGKNIQKTGHVFSRFHQGGVTPWTLLGGLDATEQTYSQTTSQDVNQWSADAGLKYQSSPDLGVTITARHANGKYPHYRPMASDDYDKSGVDLNTSWVPTGASALDATLGYTSERHSLQADHNYWNGLVRWTWTPSGLLKLNAALHRDGNASNALTTQDTQTLNLLGKIINTGAETSVSWDVTSKINLSGVAAYSRRHIADTLITGVPVSGSDETSLYKLTAKYTPTQYLDFSCATWRESRVTSKLLPANLSRPYTAKALSCGGVLWLR